MQGVSVSYQLCNRDDIRKISRTVKLRAYQLRKFNYCICSSSCSIGAAQCACRRDYFTSGKGGKNTRNIIGYEFMYELAVCCRVSCIRVDCQRRRDGHIDRMCALQHFSHFSNDRDDSILVSGKAFIKIYVHYIVGRLCGRFTVQGVSSCNEKKYILVFGGVSL